MATHLNMYNNRSVSSQENVSLESSQHQKKDVQFKQQQHTFQLAYVDFLDDLRSQ